MDTAVQRLDALALTALTPYWARVQDAAAPRPILRDLTAAAVAPQVAKRFGRLRVDESTRVGCCLRNLQVDRWLTRLAASGRIGAVVDLGVGLDTRVARLPRVTDCYVEVDQPAVIRMRDELLPANGVVRIGADVLRVEEWSRAVPPGDASVVVVLEGVLAYQRPADVRTFCRSLAARLPGAFVIFDSMSPLQRILGNRRAVTKGERPPYRWSLWRTSRLVDRPRWTVVAEQSLIGQDHIAAMGLRTGARLAYSLPILRHSHRLTLVQLAGEAVR